MNFCNSSLMMRIKICIFYLKLVKFSVCIDDMLILKILYFFIILFTGKSPLFYQTTSEVMGQCLLWEVKVMALVGVGQGEE